MVADVVIPFETARLIRNVFLPANPHKLRKAHPDTVAAVELFIARLAQAACAPTVETTTALCAIKDCAHTASFGGVCDEHRK